MTSVSDETASSALGLLFDTGIIAVTLHHMLGSWRLQKGLKHLQKRSLIRFVLQQGTFHLWMVIMGIVIEVSIRYPTLHVCMSGFHGVLCSPLLLSDLISFLVLLFLRLGW